MLSDEDNELLCRVGKGTPMGEVIRRFWLPALLSSEIAEADGPQKRLRLLGEDLLAFRDTSGRVGVVDAFCPHKLAPLFFGRNEEGGVRCVYHGWKFDVDGQCLDIPNLPATTNVAALKGRAKIVSYPVREAGGLIWVYMGPAASAPPMPSFDWLDVPPDQVRVARWLQRSNWAQGMEGEIDTSHVSFLHRQMAGDPYPTLPSVIGDGAPLLTLNETDYGFVYGARRSGGKPDHFYWRVTQWFMPMFSMIANDPDDLYPRGGRAWVPVDDEHVMIFTYYYRNDAPLKPEHHGIFDGGKSFPPPTDAASFELPDGYVIDTFMPKATRANDYGIDRARQKAMNFTGIASITDQDRSLQENLRSVRGHGPGKIVDRAREMLVPSDLPVITARRKLLKLAKDLQKGIEPALPQQPELFGERSVSAISTAETFDSFMREVAEKQV